MTTLKHLIKVTLILIIVHLLVPATCAAQPPIGPDTIMINGRPHLMAFDANGNVVLADIEQEKAEKLERQRRLERRMEERRGYDEEQQTFTIVLTIVFTSDTTHVSGETPERGDD